MNLNYNPWKIKVLSLSSSSSFLALSKYFQRFCCSCMFITINRVVLYFIWLCIIMFKY